MTHPHEGGGRRELDAWLIEMRDTAEDGRLWAGVDVDGVVFDNRPDWKTDLHADLGITPEQLSTGFFRPHWSDVVTGKRPLQPTLTDALRAMGTPVNAADLIDYWFAQDNTLHEPTLDLLKQVAGAAAPFVLLTNQEHQRAAFLWDRLRPFGCFDQLLASAHLGHTKSQRQFFTAVDARLGPRAPRALIDDSPENLDIAREHGWRTFHFTFD